jgi:hypothetical protein
MRVARDSNGLHMRSENRELLRARIRGEYKEMPGLRLTADQGSRLWGVEQAECAEILRLLAAEGFLAAGTDGKYGRPTECPPNVRPQMAKASLKDERIRDRPVGRRTGER